MKTVNTISFSRKGNLADVKNLVKRHFEAQGYELLSDSVDTMAFEKGSIAAKLYSYRPTDWKTKWIIECSKRGKKIHFKGILQRTSLLNSQIKEGDSYWQAEIQSFQNAILSEEIIPNENVYWAEKIYGGYIVNFITLLYLAILYISCIFPPITIVNYFFDFPPSASFPFITLTLLAWHIYHFRIRYWIILMWTFPIFLLTIAKRLNIIEETFWVAFVFLMNFIVFISHKKLFVYDFLNKTMYNQSKRTKKKYSIQTITPNGFELIKEYQEHQDAQQDIVVIPKSMTWFEKLFLKLDLYHLLSAEYDYLTDEITHVKRISCQTELIKWEEVATIKINLLALWKVISLNFYSGRSIELYSSYEGWYLLLRHLPRKITRADKNLIKQYFDNLELCPVCGVYAFEQEDGVCNFCGLWYAENYLYDDNNAKLIAEKQIAFLSNYAKSADFNMNPSIRTTSGFKYDENWKPIITQQEALDYLRRYNNN
jgi:hypothetical protein